MSCQKFKDMNEKPNALTNTSTRRSLLSNGGAILGACLLSGTGSSAVAQTATDVKAENNYIYNVRSFGATGKRQENATQAFRQAIDRCTSDGGGVVQVPPGEYTVGTVQRSLGGIARAGAMRSFRKGFVRARRARRAARSAASATSSKTSTGGKLVATSFVDCFHASRFGERGAARVIGQKRH